jgi:hypothetical protein
MRFRLTGALLLLQLLLLQPIEGHRITRVSLANNLSLKAVVHDRRPFIVVRGGAEVEDDDEDVEDEDVEGEDVHDDTDDEKEEKAEKEEGQKMDPKLTKSAMLSTIKMYTKKAAETKEVVSTSLKVKKSTKKGSFIKALELPYFVRACMNPFTVFAMTRAYFASLFNLNYLKEKVSIVSHTCAGYF